VTRVVLVPSTQKAIATLTSMVDALQKRGVKHLYFNKQREKHYLPDSRSSTNGGAGGTKISPSYSASAAKHVAEALRQLGERFDMPPGEADVLMSLLGTLGDIATADDNVLANIPMEDRSKQILHAFFGSHGTMEKKSNDHPDRTTIALNSLEPQPRWVSQAMGPPTDHCCDHYENATVHPKESSNSCPLATFVTPAPHHFPFHPQQNMPPNSRQMPVVALSSSQQRQQPQNYHPTSSSFRSPTPTGSTLPTRPPGPYGGTLPQVYRPNKNSFGPSSRLM
jgi:hypothetical protein